MNAEAPINGSIPSGVKFLAALLFLGGLFGIGLGVWLGVVALQQAPAMIIIAAVFVAVFAVCVWRGFELWKGKPSGYKWAKILYAAQIPVVSLSSVSYEFSTGLKLALLVGESVDFLTINLGSSLNMYLSPEIQATYFGVNLVAAIALAYLMFSRNPETERVVSQDDEKSAL